MLKLPVGDVPDVVRFRGQHPLLGRAVKGHDDAVVVEADVQGVAEDAVPLCERFKSNFCSNLFPKLNLYRLVVELFQQGDFQPAVLCLRPAGGEGEGQEDGGEDCVGKGHVKIFVFWLSVL